MRDAHPGAILLKDYQPPTYLIKRTELAFDLRDDAAVVDARLLLRRNEGTAAGKPLQLHGEGLELLGLSLDGRKLESTEYSDGSSGLVIHAPPAEPFQLDIRTRLRPQDNTSLEGLYRSRTMFCTQCEAEGFRKITYYLDRPDVMSVFEVTIEADRERYPVLLSNGNLVATEDAGGGRHRARWHDPFPKPAYLFALVAGDLACNEDRFTTASGREVCLRIYVESKDLSKCGHAMDSLQRAMRWDEEVYGREYDLDIFNIVAVDDFNMGAMENKSLNIFNSSCVLANPDITTDAGFQTVEAIVAHEYFHNWSGNRVTCRDWFQLSLKEGFTVFRDAEFSADMGSRTVKRVQDVTVLRTAQFAEDAGPMAHPVRPDSYIEISNFYTLTVYEKGAEVVRMIHTLLGAEAFRAGSDLYFSRHDGQAVTCEDFVCAMEDASGVDLGQFRRWYSQAGTPLLDVSGEYDAADCQYRLRVRQSCPATPGQAHKEPFLIPLAMGLLGEAGNLRLEMQGEAPDPDTGDNTHRVLLVRETQQEFVFDNVPEAPVPSLLRGFSAPVRLRFDYTRNELKALMSGDDDGFVRWDACQQLLVQVISDLQEDSEAVADPLLAGAFASLLEDSSLDPAMVAAMLQLPSENYLVELAGRAGGADVDAIVRARTALRRALSEQLTVPLRATYDRLQRREPYCASAAQIAARSLRNVALDYLTCNGDTELATKQWRAADNLTDRLAGLRALAFYADADTREQALEAFHRDWRHETLVLNHWLQLQATIPDSATPERVRRLLSHADFDLRNPNKVRALLGAFSGQNLGGFHRADGAGYRLLAEVVAKLNSLNPQIAARLVTPLTRWRDFRDRDGMMRSELEGLAALPQLSPDLYEVVSKSLQ